MQANEQGPACWSSNIQNDACELAKQARPNQAQLMFGVMNYFNVNEALNIYTRVREMIADDGTLVIKNQMGTVSDVIVDERSLELETYYFSHYRSISHEQKLLESCGFKVLKVTDIYPDKFNRWDNTRFTALTCECIL